MNKKRQNKAKEKKQVQYTPKKSKRLYNGKYEFDSNVKAAIDFGVEMGIHITKQRMASYNQIVKKQRKISEKIKASCKHPKEALDLRTIYRRCRCGSYLPFADPKWIKEHGYEGKADN